jgi:hypothetical protein
MICVICYHARSVNFGLPNDGGKRNLAGSELATGLLSICGFLDEGAYDLGVM